MHQALSALFKQTLSIDNCCYTLAHFLFFRKVFWRLVVFIQERNQVVDGEVTSPLDNTEVTTLLTFTGPNKDPYKTVVVPSDAVKREALFSFLVSSVIVYEDVREVEHQLAQKWTTAGIVDHNLDLSL